MVIRRRVFLLALAALAAAPARAHAPYGQWKVLRQRYLLVHSTRTDPQGDAIADALVAILQRELPAANALVARASNERRLAGLLESGQALLAVMRAADAEDLYHGRGAFAGLEGRGLRRLLAVDARLLVAAEAFPAHHAAMVSEALIEHPGALAVRAPKAGESAVPLHAGAAAR